MCFVTAAFDIDSFQFEILSQKEGHLIVYLGIRLFYLQSKLVCRVNK